jgi:peptidoglycan/LPS O-acetylase OafA/YrhL
VGAIETDEPFVRAGAPEVWRTPTRSVTALLERPAPAPPTAAPMPAAPERARHGFEAALSYRPHLDGLRALAVYLVVAFHAGVRGFDGAFVGVDVFFVLSGYLVTRILIRDLLDHGRIDFGRFYARRFRRILPAAATVLILTGLLYAVVATPLQASDASSGYRACFLYVANWHFISQSTNYFASTISASPVLHFWSLAVEEQFYLTWPLLLGGVFLLSRRAGRHRWTALRLAVLAIALLSLFEALRRGGANLNRAYYGTDTRAYQLLAGALLALTPQLISAGKVGAAAARRVAPIAMAVLVFLGTSFITLSPITRGALVVVATLALIVALERSTTGGVAGALSDKRVVYLGRVSYGTYLWHWPLIVLLTHGRHIPPTQLFVITVVVSTALAALSCRIIENPIRLARGLDRLNRRVITVALCISLSAGLLLAPAMRAVGAGSTAVAADSIAVSSIKTGTAKLLNWQAARNDIPASPECLGRPVSACIVVHGTGEKVLLMGDSLARMWLPAFEAIARRESFTLAAAIHHACPWPEHLAGLGISPDCSKYRADWYARVIPKFDPDIVVLANRSYDAPGNALPFDVSGRHVTAHDPGAVAAIGDQTRASLDALRRPGREIVLLEPTPLPADPSYDPMSCVSSGSKHCSFRVSPVTTPLTQLDRDLAATSGSSATGSSSNVWSIDLNRLACPRYPVCDPVVNGIIVRRDHTHLTGTFARALTTSLEAVLRRRNIL